MASYTQAALLSQAGAVQPTQVGPTAVPAAERIPASLARFMDVEAEIPAEKVQVDGLVVMKILKHAADSSSGSAAGVLMGLDLDRTIEVSNCFPISASSDSNVSEEQSLKGFGGRQETGMLKALKNNNYTEPVVGFYQALSIGAFLRQSVVNLQASHQESLRQGGIVLIHDASSSARGGAPLKAFRLSTGFLAANKTKKFSTSSLLENELTFSNIMNEIPLTVRTSPLMSTFMQSLSSPSTSSESSSLPVSYAQLDGPRSSSLVKTMDSLLDTLEQHRTEENNVAFHSRQIVREKARLEAHLAQKRAENATRVAQGLAALPEEDASRLFKIPPEPSRLETTLLLGQVDAYAKGMEAQASSAMAKLYASQFPERA